MSRLVESQSKKYMAILKQAVNKALENQSKEFAAGEEPEWRFIVTTMMDHTVLKELKVKVGCVNILLRIVNKDNSQNYTYTFPVHMWDVNKSSVPGTTSAANAYHYNMAVRNFFDEANMIFLASTFDGAILDKVGFQIDT